MLHHGHHTREPPTLPSIHTLFGRPLHVTHPRYDYHRESHSFHAPSHYDYTSNTLRPIGNVKDRLEELQLRSPAHPQIFSPGREIDYDWDDVTAPLVDDSFLPTDENDEDVLPIMKDRNAKKNYLKQRDMGSFKYRRDRIKRRDMGSDRRKAVQSPRPEHEDQDEQDGQRLEKGNEKKIVERKRRAREAEIIMKLEIMSGVKDLKDVKELSQSNKKASGLNYSKEDTLNATYEGFKRCSDDLDDVMERNRSLLQELDDLKKRCRLLEQERDEAYEQRDEAEEECHILTQKLTSLDN